MKSTAQTVAVDTQAQQDAARPASRLKVMHVQVQALQVWFHCPSCNAALEGYLSDPRGCSDITCDACGSEFDIPKAAELVIS